MVEIQEKVICILVFISIDYATSVEYTLRTGWIKAIDYMHTLQNQNMYNISNDFILFW